MRTLRGLVAMVSVLVTMLMPAAVVGVDIETIDGVEHVRNGATPRGGERTLRLVEVWRVDVEEEEELIGVIGDVISGPGGTVWLADRQLARVLVYSAGGRLLRTVCREGDGPGEISSPRGLVWLPDGGLGIVDRKLGQITQVDPEGTPLPSLHLRGEDGEPLASAQLLQARCRGRTLAVCGTRFLFDGGAPGQSRFLGIFDGDGREVRCLLEKPSGFDFEARTFDELANDFVDRGAWTVDDLGRVLCASERNRYRIEVHDATGALVRVIDRQYSPRRRSAEEKERIAAGVTMTINGEVVQVRCSLEDCAPCIASIEAADGGAVWVLSGHGGHGEPAGVARSYDVFDADGRFQQVVHLICDMDPDEDRLTRLADGRWILLRNHQAVTRAMFATGRDDEAAEAEGGGDGEDESLEIVCLRAVVQ
jgi:hypothetical protein